MFSSSRSYKKPTTLNWLFLLCLTQSIRYELVLAQDLELEEFKSGVESLLGGEEEDNDNDNGTLNGDGSDSIAQINEDPLTAENYVLPQQDSMVTTSILRENGDVLPQQNGEITTFISDGTVYVAEVYPTLTMTLSTVHNKVTYTTNILATSVVDKTSEYISYDYNFGLDTPQITHSSPVVTHKTTKKESAVTKTTKRTTTGKKTYPAIVKTLYSEMNASKKWWKSVISESREALATYILGPVKTAPELYLTVSEVVSTFKIVSKGWMVHYVETIPKLVTLTARGFTHTLTEQESVEYTLESFLESEWVSEQILTVHGSTIVLYFTKYLTEEDGMVRTVTLGETTILPVETTAEETLTTQDIYLTEPTVIIEDIDSESSSTSSDTQLPIITDQTPEYPKILTETVTRDEETEMMPLYEQQLPPDEMSPLTSLEPTTDFFTTPDVEGDNDSIDPISSLTFTAITVGPYDQTTTVHTEATVTTGTDGIETPAVIYHVKTPAPSTFSSALTTIGLYSYTTTVLTETTHSVGTGKDFNPGRVYHVDIPAAIQHTSATTTEGPYSFTTTILTETTFTTGTDGNTIIKNIYHVNTPSTSIIDSYLQSTDLTPQIDGNKEEGEEESNSTSIQISDSSEGDNGVNNTDNSDGSGTTSDGSTVSNGTSLVSPPITQVAPNASTTTTVGPYSFTTTYHTEITYFVGPNGVTTSGTIFHVKTPAGPHLTSTVTTVGPYDGTTTKLTETTYAMGPDGATTPQLIYHVRVPPVSIVTSAITTVGPYAVPTTIFTEETYIEGADGNRTPQLIEHVNIPDGGFVATAPQPEPQGSIVYTSTEILIFTGEDGEEISSTAYHIFVAPTTDSTSVSDTQQESKLEIHSTETLAPSLESSGHMDSVGPMTMNRDDTQPSASNVSTEFIDSNVSGGDRSMMTIHKTETPVDSQTDASKQSIGTTDVVHYDDDNDNGYPYPPSDDKDVGHLLTYFTGGGEPKGPHYLWERIFAMALILIL